MYIKILVDHHLFPEGKLTLTLVSTFTQFIKVYSYFIKIYESSNKYMFSPSFCRRDLRPSEVKQAFEDHTASKAQSHIQTES